MRWKPRRPPVDLVKKIGDKTFGTYFTLNWLSNQPEFAQYGLKTLRREFKKNAETKYGVYCNRGGTQGNPWWVFGQEDPDPQLILEQHDGSFVTVQNNKGEKMEIPMTDKSGFEKPKIEEGLYPAKLKEVKETTAGEYGERTVLVFDVLSGDEVVEMGMVAYKRITPKSRLGEAFIALGAKLSEGLLDTGKFIGTKCQVLVENYKDKEGEEVSGISKVKPAKKE